MNETLQPRIYVACLAAYNSGFLHGEWISAAQEPDAIRAEIRAMLGRSPVAGAEEWAIHDHEGFAGLPIAEYADMDDVSRWASLLAEHGPALAAYAAHVGAEHADDEGFLEAYCGQWDSEAAYAEELFDELYLHEVPEHLRYYIDYEAFARDLFLGDCFSVDADGGVYVFRRV